MKKCFKWKLALLLFATSALSGCSWNVNETTTYQSVGVKKLTDYPINNGYKIIGTQTWGFYRIGFSEPRLSDVWSELSGKVKSAGGNACIVRYEAVGNITARTLRVTCEILQVDW